MLISNFLLFQLAWFSCVLGAAHDMPWLGVLVTLVILSWHLSNTKQIKPEALLVVFTLIIGACFDQIMLVGNLIEYQNHGWSDLIVPVWILALWAAFASILNVSLAWMKDRYFIAILFGATGGPIAYLAASNIGAVTIQGYSSYVALSVGWAIITPLLLYMTKYMNGFQPEKIS